MKKLLQISLAVVSGMVIFACNKVKDLPYYPDGSAVTLTANKTAVTAAPADSNNNVITFSWTSPKYASDSATWKYVLEIDSAGRNFSRKVTRTFTGAANGSLTGKDLNSILLTYGFNNLGTAYGLDVRVVSSYSNNNERYTSNTLKIMATPYNDPSVLTSQNTSVSGTLATAANPSNTFTWSRSFNGYAGDVTYTLQYDSATKNFAAAKDLAMGVGVLSKNMTVGEMNATALNSGVPGGNTGRIEYRIKAVTAQGAVSYSNTVAVTIQSYISIIRMYLPGGYQAATGNGNDWDPGTAPELIRDQRTGLFNNMYYIYVNMPANAQFKVTQGRSWTTNYGTGSTAGSIALNGGNFTVTTAGVYRITINVATMQVDIRPGRMGFVGGATGAGWNPPNVFPNYALGFSATNLFVGTTDFTADAWKLIDADSWNNGSNSVNETRSYGANGPSGSTLVTNGPNMPNATAGRFRVIFDGTNADNPKYDMMAATEMRVVGDGMVGVNAWDPGASPQMTWLGNGVWRITGIQLAANKDIKFLAGNAWGAFDYEDASGGSQAVGVARRMQFQGGNNFRTPATAGTYTITLDEKAQTVTIQ